VSGPSSPSGTPKKRSAPAEKKPSDALNTATILTPGKHGTKARNPIVSPSASSPEIATPSSSTPADASLAITNSRARKSKAGPRRVLSYDKVKGKISEADEDESVHISAPKAKKKLPFGYPQIETQQNVKETYAIVRKLTGSIGGNGSSGAIYGELTMGSMQKMVNLMKEYTEFGPDSRFIDVGSGIGKPNIHVCQDPGVSFSYGIEMERSRWMLGMTSLKAVIDAAQLQNQSREQLSSQEKIGYNCYFAHGNIKEADTFDPFTHVYMFSIGFPPCLWVKLAKMFNQSLSPYLICYHPPRKIIETYGFEVELLTQTPTSMHGSKEGHMGYLYRRTTIQDGALKDTLCDPVFKGALDAVQSGIVPLHNAVCALVQDYNQGGRVTRSKGLQHVAEEQSKDSIITG
jgi:Histone methylation protein DOT1